MACPVGGGVQLSAHLRVSVLLGAPHQGVLLGRNLEYIWVEAIDDGVTDFGLFIDLVLRVLRQLVCCSVGGQEFS